MAEIERILSRDFKSGLLFVAGLIILAVFILQKSEWLVNRLGIVSKRQLKEEQRDKDIEQLKKFANNDDQSLKELKEHARKTDENIDKLVNCMQEMKETVSDISAQVKIMQEREDEMRRNQLRDRIGQSYRYYSERKRWNHMEKEAFDGLIQAYESVGGTNGLIHSRCIPDSLTWELVDE